MKRILVDMHRLGKNPYNGLYVYCEQLGKGLYKYFPDHFELFYYLPKRLFGSFGGRVRYIAQRSLDKFFHVKAKGFDIWHSTTTLSWYLPADKNTKFIYTLHDINFMLEQPEKARSNKRNLKLIQERIDRADHIVAISDFSLRQAKEHLNLEGKPTSVIYNGCSFVTSPPVPEPPDYIPSRPFLYSIGLVQKRKNFHTILSLLDGNDLEYVISGLDTFDYKEEILTVARKLNVSDRLIFTGPVTEAQKAWYYSNCHAFMFPSFAEGFGLPVLEAMYFGKPVFLSRETSLPEIGGKHAYYFNSFEADDMRGVFINGMKHYEETNPVPDIKNHAMQFSFEQMALKVLELYSKL